MHEYFEFDASSETLDEFQHVDITLLTTFWEELRAEMAFHQWSDEQGFRYILAAGLAALRNQRQSDALTQDESVLDAVIRNMQSEQVHLSSRYAEVRHVAGELKITATSLEVQLKACKTQFEILRKVNAELLAGLVSKR
jgi:hypothetical protein